jgi:hypothetical protein
MAKKQSHSNIALQRKVARSLWAEFWDGGRTSPAEFESTMRRWAKQDIVRYKQQANDLFAAISHRFDSNTARKVFQETVAKRSRGTEYTKELNEAFRAHLTMTGSPAKTARAALSHGLTPPGRQSEIDGDKLEDALIERLKRLLKPARPSK